MKKVTLQQIADEIGVSRITISKVINNRPGVSERTRKRIVNALIEHNYKNISRYADNVSQQAPVDMKQTIGVVSISPDFSTFWLEIIQAISGELNFYSQDVVFFFLSRNKQGIYELPQGVERNRLTGLIVINVYDDALIEQIKDTSIPSVYFDLPPNIVENDLPGDVVFVEGFNSFRKITEELLDDGYKNLAFVGDTNYAQTMLDRWRGFNAAHREKGINVNKNLCFTDSKEFLFYNQDEVDTLISGIKTLPDAFVCANDDIAKHVIIALKKQNRLEGSGIVVTGFDDLGDEEVGKYLYATVKVDTKALGLRLVRQILQRAKYTEDVPEQIFLQPEMKMHANVFHKETVVVN